MSVSSGEIFYGAFWRIEKDGREEATATIRDAIEANDGTDLYDMLDDLASKHNAHVSFSKDTITVYFGVPISTVTEAENKFDEMGILRVMDLQNGSLRKDVREEMTKVLDAIPYKLRDALTPPVFGIAWSAS
jgi:hypothetical protein